MSKSNDINFEAIGQRMQKLRKKKGFTQEYVAEALGVTVPFISNVENSKTKLNLRVLVYYSKLLDVSVDYLLSADREEEIADTGKTQQILRLLDKFSEGEKEKLISVLEILKE